jgi:hypothetical protein
MHKTHVNSTHIISCNREILEANFRGVYFYYGSTTILRVGFHYEVLRSLSDTPHSVGLTKCNNDDLLLFS